MRVIHLQEEVCELKAGKHGGGSLLVCWKVTHLIMPPLSAAVGAVFQFLPVGTVAISNPSGSKLINGETQASDCSVSEQKIHRIIGTKDGYLTDFSFPSPSRVQKPVAVKKAVRSKPQEEAVQEIK